MIARGLGVDAVPTDRDAITPCSTLAVVCPR